MKWSKAKTIFIYIFIFVNIFLFTIYKMNSNVENGTDPESVSVILEKYNIKADVQLFTSFPPIMAQIEAVCRVPGKETADVLFENPYSAVADGGYSSETEKLTVDGADFEYINTAPKREGFSKTGKNNAASKALALAKDLGVNKRNLFLKSVSENDDKSFTVALTYKYGDFPVFPDGMTVTLSKDGIISAKGVITELGEIKNQYYNTIGGVEAFIEYLSAYGSQLKKEKEIGSFECGYYISEEPGSVSSFAIPAYEVRFTDGSIIYIDGRAKIDPGFRVLN